MQQGISSDKLSALIMLAISTACGVLANNMGVLADQPEHGAASGKFFLAIALAGSLMAFLMLLSPGKGHHRSAAAYRSSLGRLAGLLILVMGYALTMEWLGFFIATSLFLALGYILFGERRWLPLLMTSVPVAALLEFLIHGVFGAALADPFLNLVGLVA